MSHSYSITPADKHIDRSIMLFLAIIWTCLIAFGFLTAIQPQWLKDISYMGRESEATDRKKIADEFLRNGEYQAALINYSKALETYPEMSSALGNMAITYAQMGNLKKAEETIMRVVNELPERAWVGLMSLGDIYRDKKDFQQAREYYTRALEGNPFPANAHMLIGYCNMELKEWDAALSSYKQALDFHISFQKNYEGSLIRDLFTYKAHPNSVERIEKLIETGYSEDLEKIYDEKIYKIMIAQNPNIAMIYNDVGIVYYNNNELEKAETYFKEALRLNPKLQNAKSNLRLIARQLKAE